MRRIFMGTARCLDQPTAEIPNITPCQHRIQKLAEALMQGCVTPTTLRDVAEDWLLA